jgi:hypothetical protein
MDPIDQFIEQVLITPLRHFRGQVSSFDTNHHDTVKQFSNHVGALFTGANPFSGPAANVIADLVDQYLQTELTLTGSGMSEHLATMSTTCDNSANYMEQSVESHQIPSYNNKYADAALAFAGTVDTGAVAQGGLDIPWDIVALVASVVVGGIEIGEAAWVCNQEATKLQDALEAVLAAKLVAEALRDTDELPIIKPPTDPTEPPGSNLLKFILVAMAIAGGLGALGSLTWLQVQQDQASRDAVLEYLRQKYGNDCTDTQLLDFLNKNPNVSLKTLDKIMQFYQVRAQANAIQSMIENSPLYNDPRYRADAEQLISRLGANKLNGMTLDQALSQGDDYFTGYANGVKGVWAEFQVGLRNLPSGTVVSVGDTMFYGIANPKDEAAIDVILNDGGTDTWIQIKNNNKLRSYGRQYDQLTEQFERTVNIAKEHMDSGQGPITVEEDLPGSFFNDAAKKTIIDKIEEIGKNAGVNVKVNTDPIAPLPSDKNWCQNLPDNVPTSIPTPTPTPRRKNNPNMNPGGNNLIPAPTPTPGP